MKRYCLAGFSVLGLMSLSAVVVWTLVPNAAEAHCQVPCGIYDDAARIVHMREDAATIAKAIDNIQKLADSHSAQDMNQLIRWVTTKEEHASNIMDVVATYFLAQRVKPATGDGHDAYLEMLERHHAVILAAMKTKQNADKAHVDELEHAIDSIAGYYTK